MARPSASSSTLSVVVDLLGPGVSAVFEAHVDSVGRGVAPDRDLAQTRFLFSVGHTELIRGGSEPRASTGAFHLVGPWSNTSVTLERSSPVRAGGRSGTATRGNLASRSTAVSSRKCQACLRVNTFSEESRLVIPSSERPRGSVTQPLAANGVTEPSTTGSPARSSERQKLARLLRYVSSVPSWTRLARPQVDVAGPRPARPARWARLAVEPRVELGVAAWLGPR